MPPNPSSVTMQDLLANAAWARRLARRLTADEATADDLVQETWIAATQHPPDSDRPVRPWLAVLRNLSIKRHLAERRRDARNATMAMPDASHSPDALLERMEVQRLLAELVGSLDEPYRQAVVLRYFEELSAAEIARRLAIPAGTVRWRIKVALDELKKRLDERHGGRRAQWLAALLPLGGARRPRVRLWPWAFGAAAVGTALVLVVGAGHRAGGSAGPAGEGTARNASFSALSGSGPPPVTGARSVPPVDLAGCQKDVERLRAESAEAEAERRERLPPEELFAQGAANPAAAQAVTPALERILKGDRAAAPGYSLECRTWACRLLLAQTEEEERRTNEWQLPLQRDEEMRERTAGMGFRTGNPTKDPLSGVGLSQSAVFFKLADPSGQRVPQPRPAPMVVGNAPPPATPASCASERATLRSQIQAAHAYRDAHLRADERFALASPDPQLAEELRANILTEIRGPDGAGLEVECRALICRARWKDAPRDWQNQLHRGAWFRRMVDGLSVGRELYFMMAPGPRGDGMGFVQELVKRFDSSRRPDDCVARFPATGTLRVKFFLPKTGEPNEEGELGRISAMYGDVLAGSPLAKCMQEALFEDVLSAPLPQLPVGGAVVYKAFSFPRGGKEAARAKR